MRILTFPRFFFFLGERLTKIRICTVSLWRNNLGCKNSNFYFHKFTGLASTYPEPTNVRKWLEDQLYNFNYESSMPITWKWPTSPPMKTRELIPTKLTEKEETP